jgi:hypothetical protein
MAVAMPTVTVRMTMTAVTVTVMIMRMTMTCVMIVCMTMTSVMIMCMTMTHNGLNVLLHDLVLWHVGLFGPLECGRLVMTVTMMVMCVTMTGHMRHQHQADQPKQAEFPHF